MKKVFSLLLVILLSNWAVAQITDYSIFDKKFNFYVANDLGRNGYYDQKPIVELMGTMAEEIGPEFVVATGDIHHFEGVRSVNDPLWMTNYELIYSHPELMIDWFPVLGNHEYRGNTQAVLDYTNISRRWTMPARYYTKAFEDKGTTIRIVWIDTTPLIDKYRNVLKPMHDEFIEPTKQHADIIIPNGGENVRAVAMMQMYILSALMVKK